MDWYFSQMKGTTEEDINEADIISCLEFDETGEFVATGDKGGRVVVFKRNPANTCVEIDYGVHCTFTSHEPEFDYLKSLEIEEKINKIRWLPQCNDSRFLLSTNDKTIKLWKITEHQKRLAGLNFSADETHRQPLTALPCAPPSFEQLPLSRPIQSAADIRVPYYLDLSERLVTQTTRRTFANAHAYHINSISVNSDQQTFLSADDLRINIWNLQLTNQSFNVVDIKPANMEDLTEVITAAQFHPSCCSLLIYSSSKGTVRLCDMRERALCDNGAIVFEEPDDSTSRSFFSEIISSISDINFSHSGRYILSRDYLTLKVWDMNMSKMPLATYPVHDYLRMKLCALYENDCIFDKFECCWSPDDRHVLTGSYNNLVRIFEREGRRAEVTLELGRQLLLTCGRPLSPRTVSVEGGHQRPPQHVSVDCLDFQRRLLHLAWHPQQPVLALAATNNLYVLHGSPSSTGGGGSSSGDDRDSCLSGAPVAGASSFAGATQQPSLSSSSTAASASIERALTSQSTSSMTTTATSTSTSGYSSNLLPASTSDERMDLD